MNYNSIKKELLELRSDVDRLKNKNTSVNLSKKTYKINTQAISLFENYIKDSKMLCDSMFVLSYLYLFESIGAAGVKNYQVCGFLYENKLLSDDMEKSRKKVSKLLSALNKIGLIYRGEDEKQFKYYLSDLTKELIKQCPVI